MANVVVTGASGFLATALIPKLIARGDKVYGISRHALVPREGLVALRGDILDGLEQLPFPSGIDAVYHLAAKVHLGEDRDGSVLDTNVRGTRNILFFCAGWNVPHLYFCSTAFTNGRNTYEKSKAVCEELVTHSDIPKKTIFKPSIIMGTDANFPGHFSQFILVLVRFHRRAELIRRRVEGTLRLPVIEPVFRLRGIPEARINLIPVDAVAEAMAYFRAPGVFYLTHPAPPTLQELADWVGEFIMVRMKVLPEFKAMPLEAIIHLKTAAFLPYLEGQDFRSDIAVLPPITREFIQNTAKQAVIPG